MSSSDKFWILQNTVKLIQSLTQFNSHSHLTGWLGVIDLLLFCDPVNPISVHKWSHQRYKIFYFVLIFNAITLSERTAKSVDFVRRRLIFTQAAFASPATLRTVPVIATSSLRILFL